MQLILSASSLVPTRVRVAKRRDVRPLRHVAARAAVKWSIDGVGCEEMRLGDDTTMKKNKNVVNNIVSCPIAPVDITSMCKSNQGAFTLFDALFQLVAGRPQVVLEALPGEQIRNPEALHATGELR